MSAAELSVYGEWLVQEANGCTCQGTDAHYGHQPGCGYEPLLKVAEIKDALRAAGYAVVELPATQTVVDMAGNRPQRFWEVSVENDAYVTIRPSDQKITNDGVRNPYRSSGDARAHAAALLAAADAAETAS